MQTKMKLTVLGARKFNDVVEGTKYDFTKLIVMLGVSTSSGNEVGFNAQVIPFLNSDEFAKIHHHTYPCEAELDIELTTKGMVCHGFKHVGKSSLAVAA